MSFELICQKFTLPWEGGAKITNIPGDTGGVTKYGISSTNNPDVDVENLTEEQAMEIYKERYWNPIAQGQDDNLDMAAFDSAVNCGVGTVKKWLPECDSWADITAMRRQHYNNLAAANPNDEKFLAGWENRVKALEAFIQENS
jgi:hypothetical protein